MSDFPWTTPSELVEQVRKHWDSGRLLAERFEDSRLFPLKLRTRNARSRDLSDRFDRVREWVGMLRKHDRQHRGFGYEIEWRRVNHRTRGANDLPKRIVVPSRDDALKMIGKTRAAASFDRLADDLLADFPQLGEWLARRPLVALARADDWPRLKTVLAWFRDHPRPGMYLRQLDIPGVDTKFIQTRRQLVGELLDQVLPPEAIDREAIGVRLFEQRYGLKGRPPLIRFRVLDPALKIAGLSDLSVLPAEFAQLEFAQLNPPVARVFVTENEINGLAFPPCPGAIVIFGLGYGLDRLADIAWLERTEVWYWGDIDTHGFAILNRLRRYLPHARSFLMDRATLDMHRSLCVQESADQRFTGLLQNLNQPEQALYQALRDDTLGPRLRLEQERISYAWLESFLGELAAGS